jgi:outer membrane immunogenic protein
LAGCIAAPAAQAADISVPLYRPVAAYAPYSWAGCYVGVEGGGAFGTSSHDANAAPLTGTTITGDFGIGGSLIGGTVGCNLQSGIFVFGVENDMSWTNTVGSAYDVPPFDPTTLSQTKMNWIDTLRGRAGITYDRWFGYVTGGAAFAGTNISVCNASGCVGDSKNRTGWTVGAGVEYEMIDNWTLKVEYLYANFGSPTYIGSGATLGGVAVGPRSVPLSESIARVGVNLKLGPSP